MFGKDIGMPRSTVTSKGQITIPKSIRDRLGLAAGDTLEFTVDAEGRIVAQPREAGPGIQGILRDFAPDRALSVEEMKETVRQHVAGKAGVRKK